MKIGIYLGDIEKPLSIGELTFELAFVNELLKREVNHEFVFYYFGKNLNFKEEQNAKFVSLPYYKKPEFSFSPFRVKTYKSPIFSLNYMLNKDCVNVVYFLAPYLHEHIEIPYFAVVRDVSHRILPHFPEFSSNRFIEKMEKKFNLFLTSASKIITFNPVAKSDIKTLYDVTSDNILTMPLACPDWPEKIKFDGRILDKNDLSKNNYILYPAQFWTHKNHIRLILVAQILQEQNINLKVVFTGLDRGNKEYLIKEVERLDLQNEVVFLDYVKQNELATLYKNAYAMVYPSLAGPDSIAALEAMYFNCPVLIADHVGYKKQLNNAALYINPLDESDIVEKILMLNDVGIKDDLVSNGQLLIREYTFNNYMDSFLNMMDNFYSTRRCWSLEESYRGK